MRARLRTRRTRRTTLVLALSDQLDDSPGAVGEAREFLARAAELAPDDYLSHYHLGSFLLNHGEPGEARLAADRLGHLGRRGGTEVRGRRRRRRRRQ